MNCTRCGKVISECSCSRATPTPEQLMGVLEDMRLIRAAAAALVETCDASTWRLKDALGHYKNKV